MAMRKPGYVPKRRGAGNKKRNAVIFVNAEGKNKTETNYLKRFINRNVPIHFISGQSTDPVNMVKELIDEMEERGFDKSIGDRAFCLIDSDVKESKNLKITEADKRAKKQNIELIVSAPCFENWFLCHFGFSTRQYASNDELITELRKKIPDYTKNSVDVYTRLAPLTDVAIENAKRQEKYLEEDGRVRHTVEFMPSAEVYIVIQGIREIEQNNR